MQLVDQENGQLTRSTSTDWLKLKALLITNKGLSGFIFWVGYFVNESQML